MAGNSQLLSPMVWGDTNASPQTIRLHGYSEIANFAVSSVYGAGVPVLDRVRQPIVAMSVTTISSRMTSNH
ncbi:TPA: hypothetical protein ACHOZW_004988 [Raoultella ornithinolytica]|uniref:hypothetical protein n=1 Tax=Enterobacteriaceae TaxID=543 RepID=UPI000FCBD900|nr:MULTISPECIES: hypothetical protein [Enterobacteriaceae]MBZ7625782.1 hypothetical protein [Klebsiella michiganensis]MCW9599796.1 hypothetical protein [Klebsiella michiganensis]MCW9644408.1 hypothetical protein [Klebsiella michiganensis]